VDTRTLFRKISQKMHADFEAAAQINHSVSKGTFRENVLKDFLAEGRMPYKYGIGSGEVVGRVRDTSKQCDLIVYDRLNGVKLLYDEAIQVFPIDCIYGIIEVKSTLSKEELIDSLTKIKVLKSMAPRDAVEQVLDGGIRLVHSRPIPFGAVFAYRLADNSLDSLLDNLREWERDTPASLWPNYICILGTGTIYHYKRTFEICLDSFEITSEAWPSTLSYGEDSLFQFYCAIHDMCAHMDLGPVDLMHYYKPPVQIGKYVVSGSSEFRRIKNGALEKKTQLTEAALERIVNWCGVHGPIQYREVLKKQLGPMSPESSLNTDTLNQQVYLYNPGNLPGLHEIGENPVRISETGAEYASPCLASSITLDIDQRRYVIALCALTETDFEEVQRM
jgi:hypothetical protein